MSYYRIDLYSTKIFIMDIMDKIYRKLFACQKNIILNITFFNGLIFI